MAPQLIPSGEPLPKYAPNTGRLSTFPKNTATFTGKLLIQLLPVCADASSRTSSSQFALRTISPFRAANYFSYLAIGRRQELSERSVQFFRRKHSPCSINAFPS